MGVVASIGVEVFGQRRKERTGEDKRQKPDLSARRCASAWLSHAHLSLHYAITRPSEADLIRLRRFTSAVRLLINLSRLTSSLCLTVLSSEDSKSKTLAERNFTLPAASCIYCLRNRALADSQLPTQLM